MGVERTGDTFFPFCELTFINPLYAGDGVPGLPGAVEGFQELVLSSDKGGVGVFMDVGITGEFGGKPQQAEILIKNLSPASKRFIRRLTRCNVVLGYRDGVSNGLFSGIITRRENYRRGPDDHLILSLLDDIALRWNKRIAFTFEDATEAADIIRALATALQCPIGRIDDTGVSVRKFVSGDKSALETVRELIEDYIAPATQQSWKFNFREGSVNLMPFDEGFLTGIFLSPPNGLVTAEFIGTEYDSDIWNNVNVVGALSAKEDGTIVDGNGEDLTDSIQEALTLRDVQFESVLRPSIVADSIVKLDSHSISGFYRVKQYSHSFVKDSSYRTSGTLTPLPGTIALESVGG